MKKDSVFSTLINKIIRKPDNNVNTNSKKNNNINQNPCNIINGISPSGNEIGKIKTETELKESYSSSKSLEIIKQKKLSRIGLGDGNVSKKLASDNIDYEPVFK